MSLRISSLLELTPDKLGPEAQAFHKAMPSMRLHEGLWIGEYVHVSPTAEILDRHQTSVRCEFPSEGNIVYRQYNHFIWDDGREYQTQLPGWFENGRLWWDTPTFHGSCWETHDGLILLSLDRKDEPNARFAEVIAMGDNGDERARTWHWFKDGKLFKRTLCHERRVSNE